MLMICDKLNPTHIEKITIYLTWLRQI